MLLCLNASLSAIGELRTLFGQSEAHGDYLDKFFLKHNRPFASWIQDLDKERFHSAAGTLLAESENVGDLAAKEVMEYHVPNARADFGTQLMLSIGKLTHLAQMQEDTAVDENMLDGMMAVAPPS
jgi:nuclear pore complex protein Nup133